MQNRMQGLRTVIYWVSNVTEAKSWYAKAFETEPYFDEPYYVGFNIAGYELGLHPEAEDATKGENVVAYWGVTNVESEFERLLLLGATVHENPTNVGGEIVVAAVKDPWKNVIGLIYNPEFRLP